MNINKKIIEVGWQAALSCHAHHGMSGWSSHRKEYIKAAVDEVKKSQEYNKAASELRRLVEVEAERDALKAENERLLAANLDCIMHYEDARAELERIKSMEPVAWMYDRVGSAFNPQFLPAGPNADQQRNGIVSEGVVILNPDSSCKNWRPLIALGSKTA